MFDRSDRRVSHAGHVRTPDAVMMRWMVISDW